MAQLGSGEPLRISLSSIPSPARMLCHMSPDTCPSPSMEVGAIVSLHDERKLREVTRDARPQQGPHERGPGHGGDSTVSSHCSTATGEPGGTVRTSVPPSVGGRGCHVPMSGSAIHAHVQQAQAVGAALSAHQTKEASWRRLQQGSRRGRGGGAGCPSPWEPCLSVCP